jgi:CCR4-NOT transcription complex subunit 1
MISQYGMDVFPKFFRRGLVLNADHIFNSNPTQQGSYELLLKYVQKIRTDPDEADHVAQSIDFDVSKFMDHFKLDPIAKTMLALSLKTASKADLRTKGDSSRDLSLTRAY